MLALLDYGSGNLRSAERALATTGKEVLITSDFETCLEAEGLVVPCVGAFGRCMAGLERVRGGELIRRRFELERPTLGICIGMQILFASSSESPDVDGVAFFPDRIERLDAPIVPHMGWNRVKCADSSSLFHGLEDEQFYFVHSYAVKAISTDAIHQPRASMSSYGEDFVAAIEHGSLSATQFHPEKSGSAGLQLLDNWVSTFN